MATRRMNVYQKIHHIVVIYLIENVGEMAMAGVPRYDEKLEQWRVPVLCRTVRGILPGGEIRMTKRLRIAFATPREEMLRNVEAQLKELEKLSISTLLLTPLARETVPAT